MFPDGAQISSKTYPFLGCLFLRMLFNPLPQDLIFTSWSLNMIFKVCCTQHTWEARVLKNTLMGVPVDSIKMELYTNRYVVDAADLAIFLPRLVHIPLATIVATVIICYSNLIFSSFRLPFLIQVLI